MGVVAWMAWVCVVDLDGGAGVVAWMASCLVARVGWGDGQGIYRDTGREGWTRVCPIVPVCGLVLQGHVEP